MRATLEIVRQEWSRGWRDLKTLLPWREVMLFCLPALIVAIVVRAALWSQAPSAFVNSDVRSIISGSLDFAEKGELDVGSRRTFLGPLLYALPMLLHLPLLPTITFGQHLLGISLVPVTGVIAALWFKKWRLWIIPLTLLMAIDAFLLVFEHVALPDYLFAYFLVVMFMLATFFYRKPSWVTFGLLLIGTFFVVGARQEGRYYCMVPMALTVVVFWREWPRLGAALTIVILFTLAAFAATETTQSGQMLLASTLKLMPDELKTAPGLPEKLRPLRAQVAENWTLYPAQHNSTRKALVSVVREYLVEQRHVKVDDAKGTLNKFCKKAALEVILRQPWQLPLIGFRKFLASHNELPSKPIGIHDNIKEHVEVFFDKAYKGGVGDAKSKKYIKAYYGRDFDTASDAATYFRQIYPEPTVNLLHAWEEHFVGALIHFRLPDIERDPQFVIGLPILYMIAVFGILGLAIREGRGINIYWILLFSVAAVTFMIFTAANTRARYRISLEPLWWLGLFAFCDVALSRGTKSLGSLFKSGTNSSSHCLVTSVQALAAGA